jgi:hypothetical protein
MMMATNMLGPLFEKLLSIASPALLNSDDVVEMDALTLAGVHAGDFAIALNKRNGFFAFEGALRFFPSRSVPISYGLPEWNSWELWRFEYGDLTEGCFFFAEDIFGGQFCVLNGKICTFDPETGQREELANTLEEWAAAIFRDYEILTGYKLAHEWQSKHGKLVGRDRLVPKTPFVTGGAFALSNLAAFDAVNGMRARGNLARQIRDLPDGARVRFVLTPQSVKGVKGSDTEVSPRFSSRNAE